MSNQNLPAVQVTDISPEDQEKLNKFVERGSPGADFSDEAKITTMLDLYLGGKTYSQIARITRSSKESIMLYSQKLNWYPLKVEYLQELEMHLKGRLISSKIANTDFLLQLSQMYQKKIGAKMDLYLKTNDETAADKINLKEIDKYIKIVETLHKISETPPKEGSSKPPAVGINVGDGVTLTKGVDGSVEITPKQKTIGSMLEYLANQRRAAEAEAKRIKSNDIKDVTTPLTDEGDPSNEIK